MIVKQITPKLIILGLIIGMIIISLLFMIITIPHNDIDTHIIFAVVGSIIFLIGYLGAFAVYGLVKAINTKQFRPFISWIVLIGIFFLISFAFEPNGQHVFAPASISIGLMIMGVNEIRKMWQTQKSKSNNQ